MNTITTVQGDTWDTIALRAYGSVLRAQELMEARANVRLLDYQIFPGGIQVAVPDIEESAEPDDLPDWRK